MIRHRTAKRLPEGYRRRQALQPAATTRGTSGCAWRPTATCSRPSATARPTSSPTPSRRFTETGIKLESGEELDADIIVTATGLNLQLFGGVALIASTASRSTSPTRMAYKGMMLSGVPNMAFTIGYTNASWTLKADLVSEYVCRLLNYMDANGYDTARPESGDPEMQGAAAAGLLRRLRAAGAGSRCPDRATAPRG